MSYQCILKTLKIQLSLANGNRFNMQNKIKTIQIKL